MSADTTNSTKDLTPVRFHFYRLSFTPLKDVAGKKDSEDILRAVITYLQQQQIAGQGFLVDKNEGRKKEAGRRPLFVVGINFMVREKRTTGSIALLRAGKIPKLKPHETFALIPLDKSKGEIAEETHFFIDYSTNNIILCVEFNNEGPRVSDIEFYFRIVARDKLRLAKATTIEMFLDTPIDKTLEHLKDVLNFDLKLLPKKMANLNKDLVNQYFTGVSTLSQLLDPKYIKLEASFQTTSRQVKSKEVNRPAVNMIKRLLESFKASPTDMDAFDNFVVKYETLDGREEYFNLFKGRKELEYEIDVNNMKGRMWYELIEKDLTAFVNSLST